jgi:hypothetical protein
MVSEQTREEDERLREKLRHVDLQKLKDVLKPILTPSKKQKPSSSTSKSPSSQRS